MYPAATKGEALMAYVHSRIVEDKNSWTRLHGSLRPIGNHEQLTEYYALHAATYLTCKLMTIARYYGSGGATTESQISTVIERYPWNRINQQNKLLRLLCAAVRSADRPINKSEREQLKHFAKREHQFCYICGKSLNFTDDNLPESFTIEHLWPSSLGGDSFEENFLPACYRCNGKKGNVATWVSTDVHTIFSCDETEDKVTKMEFRRKYALLHREALTYAIDNGVILRDAFIAIGPFVNIRFNAESQIADMFDMRIHGNIHNS